MSLNNKKISVSDVAFMSSMSWMSGLMLGMTICFFVLAQQADVMYYFTVTSATLSIGSVAAYLWRLKVFCENNATEE
jgi:hypothetical protein